MDRVWALVTVLATATVIYVLSAFVGAKLERWRDDAGIDLPKRARRTSTARSAAGLALVIYGAGLGAGGLIMGGAWIAVGALLILGGLVGGIVVLKTGREVPPPPPPPAGPRHAGLAYFWHCRLPAAMLDYGRAMGLAFVGPPATIVLLAFERWLPAALFGAGSVAIWTAILKAKPRSVPRRGPCLRAE